MKQSRLFTKTLKETPKGEKSINAILLQRAGFIYKEMAGVYTFLPLGLKVLKKIENIVRQEMEKISAQEVLMTVLQPRELWQKTGRWSSGIGEEIMYKCQGEKRIGLGPTHEEMLTEIVKNYIKSYHDLPLAIFQIQTKFRKEPRAKSGLLRGREFGMKDLYSFHCNLEDFKRYYEKVKKSYFRIFKRCKLQAILTEASGGDFTKEITHEFQVLAPGGEDTIIFCQKHHFSQNKEIAKFKSQDKCPICKAPLQEGRSIEVGNIFPLGCKYSKAIGAFFQDKDGKRRPIIMGCYGLGTSRLMGAIVEVWHDSKGIIWPEEIAPFKIHLLVLPGKNFSSLKKLGEKLYFELKKANLEVLFDERKEVSSGEKLVEADLIGIPWRVVISEKTTKKELVEVKKREKKKPTLIKIKKATNFFAKS